MFRNERVLRERESGLTSHPTAHGITPPLDCRRGSGRSIKTAAQGVGIKAGLNLSADAIS
jgi:hypothetical protein